MDTIKTIVVPKIVRADVANPPISDDAKTMHDNAPYPTAGPLSTVITKDVESENEQEEKDEGR